MKRKSTELEKIKDILKNEGHFTKFLNYSTKTIEYSSDELKMYPPSPPDPFIQHKVTFKIIGLEMTSTLINELLSVFPNQMVFIGVPFEFQRSHFTISWHEKLNK